MDNTNIFDEYRGNIEHLRGSSIDSIVVTETMLVGCDRYIHLHF